MSRHSCGRTFGLNKITGHSESTFGVSQEGAKQRLVEGFLLDASCFVPHAQVMTFTKNIGMLLLAIFLIIYGLIAVFGFTLGVVNGIIAILAGICIILGR